MPTASTVATPAGTSEEYERQLLEAPASQHWVTAFGEIPSEALAWIALSPILPRRAVERGFPGPGGLTLTGKHAIEFAEELAKKGVCEISRDGGESTEFYMSAPQRSAAMRFLAGAETFNPEKLRNELRSVARAVTAALKPLRLNLSTPMRRWALLARNAVSTRGMGAFLERRVQAAVQASRRRRATACPDAVRWIEAAVPLVSWFGSPLEASIAAARRRLELFHREAFDFRVLDNYFVRDAQDNAFRALLDVWALHYVGYGGTGKTMFLRHLARDLLSESEFVSARIDFDHLNPDYPSRAPGIFLCALAEELRLRAAVAAEDIPMRTSRDAFAYFDDKVRILHERIDSTLHSGGFELVSAENGVLWGVIDEFSKALDIICAGRTPMLILDTCEELARIRADGTLPESVRVTFDLLKAIHDRLPKLRVVFAGRRPLASRGADWEHVAAQRDSGSAQPNETAALPERPFLRLYEIRGFTEQEARDFLRRYNVGDAHVNPELLEPILTASRVIDEETSSRFRWSGEASGQNPVERHFNPFDLDLFAQWSCANRNLKPEVIAEGVHHYIEERILGRLSADLLPLIPWVALLGRFTEEIAGEFLAPGRGLPRELRDELVNQEWIDIDHASKLAEPVWAVNALMRRRLLDYYRKSGGGEFARACHAAGTALLHLTLTRPWDELAPEHFEAVLMALAGQPVEAAKWWDKVEARLAEDSRWEWARSLPEALLADDAVAGPPPPGSTEPPHPMRAAIYATWAAGETHLSPRNAVAKWNEVAKLRDESLTPEDEFRFHEDYGEHRLRFRTFCGLLAGLRWPETDPSVVPNAAQIIKPLIQNSIYAQENNDWERAERMMRAEDLYALRPQEAVSFLAAWEGVIDAIERLYAEGEDVEKLMFGMQAYGFGIFGSLGDVLDAFADALCKSNAVIRLPVWAHAYLILRFFHQGPLTGDQRARPAYFDNADLFRNSLEKLRGLPPLPQKWLDWVVPTDLASRARLEAIRTVHPNYLNPEETLKLVSDEAPQIRDLDGDRLASALLTLRGCISSPDLESLRLSQIGPSCDAQGGGQTCQVHRAGLPYFAVALEELAVAVREGPRAIDALMELRNKGLTQDIRQEADRALIRITLRLRLTDEKGFTLGETLHASPALADYHLRMRLALLEGERSNDDIYGVLRNDPMGGERRRQVISWLLRHAPEKHGPTEPKESLPSETATFEDFQLALDELADPDGSTRLTLSWAKWLVIHPPLPVHALILLLRSGPASRWVTERDVKVRSELVRRVGIRRAAMIAEEEGTRLALRGEPRRAIPRLELANEWFRECGDSIGCFFASLGLALAAAREGDVSTLTAALETCRTAQPEVIGGDCGWFELHRPALESTQPEQAPEKPSERGWPGDAKTQFLTWINSGTPFSRPVMIRLAACITRRQQLIEDLPNPGWVMEWVEQNYSTQRGDRKCLPAEFTGLFGTAHPSSTTPATHSRRQVREALLGFAILIAVWGLLNIAVHLTLKFFHIDISLWQLSIWDIAFMFAVVLAARYLPVLNQRLFTALAANFTLDIQTFQAGDQVTDPNFPLRQPAKIIIHWHHEAERVFRDLLNDDATQIIRHVLGLTLFYSGGFLLTSVNNIFRSIFEFIWKQQIKRLTQEIPFPGTTEERYAELSATFPAEVRPRRLRQLLRPVIEFRLTLSEAQTAAPWEALLTFNRDEMATFQDTQRLVRRVLTAQDSVRIAETPSGPVGILAWAGESAVENVARLGWGSGASEKDSKSAKSPPFHLAIDTFSTGAFAPEMRILHFFGHPVEMSDGVKFAIGSGSGFESGTYVLRADEIILRFPKIRLCIIQGVPEEIAERPAARAEAALVRRFAAAVFRYGVPAVLVLPPLPGKLAEQAISAVAAHLYVVAEDYRRRGQRRGGPKRWLRVVRCIQETIASDAQWPTTVAGREMALEIPFDVCLYMNDDFDLPITSAADPHPLTLTPNH